MALTKYTYSISGDFPNGKVNSKRLTRQIEADSGIPDTLDRIDKGGDDCDIWFDPALTSGEEDELDAVVAAHTGYKEASSSERGLDMATAPPGSPDTGDTYVLGTGSTGAWSGKDGLVAEWLGSAWDFRVPEEGAGFWSEEEAIYRVWNGSEWGATGAGAVTASAVLTSTQNSSFEVLGSMTTTPNAGTFQAHFSTSWKNSATSGENHLSIFAGGVEQANSARRMVITNLKQKNMVVGVHSACEVVLDGSQAVEVKWKTNGTGTATAYERSLVLLRVK